MTLPGDLGFMTGLTAGRREASQVDSEWKQYAQGLNNQITALSQQLQREAFWRSAYRADGAAVLAAINTLPPEIREMVAQAVEATYEPTFNRRAAELGLPGDYAASTAREMRSETIAAIRPRL